MSAGKVREISSGFGFLLDAVRAFAAISVFVEHLRAPLYHGYSELPDIDKNVFVRIWFFVTGFGFESVIIFFVMSGFLIGGSGFVKITQRRFQLAGYTADRLARLFVVLVPALIFTYVLDHTGVAFFKGTGFWNGLNPNFSEKFGSFEDNMNFGNMICNAVMLQSFKCPVYGSNVPLWSLSYEFWFYLVFFLFAVIVLANSKYKKTLALFAIILTSAFLGQVFVKYLAIWLIGALAYVYHGRKLCFPIASIASYLAFAAVSRLVGVGDASGSFSETLVLFGEAIAFAWVIVSYRNIEWNPAAWLSRLGSKLAGFSYTLYLIHFPLMLIVIAMFSKVFRIDLTNGLSPSSTAGVTMYVGVIISVIVISRLFSMLTEAHTRVVRDALWRMLTYSQGAQVSRSEQSGS